MHRWSVAVAACLAAMLAASPPRAHAFAIGSTISDSCHEEITLSALAGSGPLVLTPREDPDAAWWRLGGFFGRQLQDGEPDTASERLVLTSAILGVRFPDLGEMGLVHIHNLREVHLLEERQVYHFLRRGDHDGLEGQRAAIEAGRAHILALIDASALAYRADPSGESLGVVRAYVERYGQIEVEVWLPLYLLAQALHALQDSFTHSYRSEDGRRILAVQNYIEAVTSDHDEARDGPRHSDALDDCAGPEVGPLFDVATLASAELVAAVQRYWRDGDRAPVEAVLDAWTTADESCGVDDDYCGSRWPAIARTIETKPLLGCGVSPAAPGAAWPGIALAVVACARRRRRASA